MGFYIRKSLSVGPLRFNLSKSGIGVSTGVKGLRFGSGPRGNYIHMGRGGLYYRATLPSGNKEENIKQEEEPSTQIIYESGEIRAMTDSSSEELLKEINTKINKPVYWPYIFSLGLIITILGYLMLSSITFTIVMTLLTFSSFYFIYNWDQLRKNTVLFYEFDDTTELLFKELCDAFNSISSCVRIWNINSETKINNNKYYSGASSLVNRISIGLVYEYPPFIKTNINIPCIPVGRRKLYFFPDRILVYDKTQVGAISYNSLHVEISETNFIEEDFVPNDAKVIGSTWKYVNKNGGPDKRFRDNRELLRLRYEQLHFTSSKGLNELIQLSAVGKARLFQIALFKHAQYYKQT